MISFVIPCYNKEAYISEAIQSLLNQTEKDIEIVVVDDCSTDDSKAIIEWFVKKDPRVRLISLLENKGRSYARNIGNKDAKGNVICVQDADDVSTPDRAEIVKEFFKKKAYSVFYTSFGVADKNLTPIQEIKAEAFDIEKVKTTKLTYIGHSTMAYRKKVADEVHYTEGDYSKLGIDDWKFQLDAYKKGYKFGFSEKPTVIYRQVGNSISANRDENEVSRVKDEFLKSL